MKASRPRRIYVPFALEPEVSERHGKYVKLDGRTYLVSNMSISGTEPITVELADSQVPEGHDLKDIAHWMHRDRGR